MDRNESIQKIKELMSKLLFNEVKVDDIKLSDITLKDGTVLQSPDSELKVGSEVTNADGSPVIDGDYILEDGSTISVLSGKVAEISTAQEEAQDPTEVANVEAKIDASVDSTATTPTGDTSVEDRVLALESQLTEILSILKDMGNMNKQLMNRVNEISDEPSDKPVENKEKEFKSYSKEKVTNTMVSETLDEIRNINKGKNKKVFS